MQTKSERIFKFPFVSSAAVFILVLALTQYLTYQEFRFTRDKEYETLKAEAVNAKDKLRNILYTDISAANALALVYKEYGLPRNFDSVAAQLTRNNLYVETIVLVRGSIISNVYPLNEQTRILLGGDIMRDSVVKKEAQRAIARQGVFFSGPRKLKIGGEGIWGEVPIITNGQVIGFAGVLTRLPSLRKALDISPNGQGKFAYILSKANSSIDSTEYLLSLAQPGEDAASASVEIPEGDWNLKVLYAQDYTSVPFPYKLSAFSFILSLVISLFAYRRFNEPIVLKKVIEEKTHEVNERVKELTTIYRLNKVLQDETQGDREVFEQIVKLITPGWQYSEFCEARITFANRVFQTPGYQDGLVKQVAAFELIDGRSGSIDVVYTREMPASFEGPFLKEERDLINTLAETIKIYFNKAIHQRSLSESEARFRGAFENSAIGMGLVSNEGQWQLVNKGLCEMMGYTEKEFLGLSFQKVTHPDDLAADLQFRERALKGEADYYQTEKRYFHKKGFIVWVNVHVAVIRAGSKPLYFVVQVENITGRRESQLEKEKLLSDLIQRNRDLEQFSFIVSHNIRAPLATLLGLRNMLDLEIPEEEKAMVIEGMGEYAIKLDHVVKDVTEILNLRKGSLQPKVKVNLPELVRSVSADLLDMIGKTGTGISCDFSAADSIDAIPDYMHSIFLNLIANSIKYARHDLPAEVSIWSERRDGKLNICFSDNGIGIDIHKHRDDLFVMYRKIHPHAEGKGMGLFMVKTQVNAMGGTIDVQSEPGKGTTFIMTFQVLPPGLAS